LDVFNRNHFDEEADRLWKMVPVAPPSHARYQADQEVWGKAYEAAARADALRASDAAAKDEHNTAATYFEGAYDRVIQAVGWYKQSGNVYRSQGLRELANTYEAKRKQSWLQR